MRKRNLAKKPEELEDPADMGVGEDVAELANKEVDAVELADMIYLSDVGKEHKQLRKKNLVKKPKDLGNKVYAAKRIQKYCDPIHEVVQLL